MSLEIYQIIILIAIGSLVGLGMSFIGQTGQGLVMPIVLMITGDVFLTIAINILNDLIAALSVSIGYLKKREFKVRLDTFIFIIVAISFSLIGIIILMITPLGNIYGWFIPIVIVFIGLLFVKSGYATTEKLRNIVKNIYRKVLEKKGNEQDIKILEELKL